MGTQSTYEPCTHPAVCIGKERLQARVHIGCARDSASEFDDPLSLEIARRSN